MNRTHAETSGLTGKEFVREEIKVAKFLREGGNHIVFHNPLNMKTSTISRHTEIVNALAKKICNDLEVHQPKIMRTIVLYGVYGSHF